MARTKGTALIPLVRFLRAQRERAAEVLTPELQPYLEEHVLASSWYPESHLLGLLRAAAELVGGARDQTLREFGRVSARHHLEGIYSHLRLEEDPLAFPRRAFALWSSQHDTGQLRMALEGDGLGRVRVEGYDSPSMEMCQITFGYISEVLSQAGLGEPRIDKKACRNQGDGVCEWSVRWGPGEALPT